MSMLPSLKKIQCGEGRTKQKTGVEHDINKLVARYQKTGVLPMREDAHGLFTDVCMVGDYMECQNRVLAAQDAFNSLGSVIRKRFGNSPDAFMEYMSSLGKDSIDEAVALGLVEKKVVPVDNAQPATANKNDDKGDK